MECVTCEEWKVLQSQLRAMPRATHWERRERMRHAAAETQRIDDIDGPLCPLCEMKRYPPWHKHWSK